MAKIVKYCASCDEGFAEKFGFCPNCGAPLSTFEMKPVADDGPRSNEPVAQAVVEPHHATDSEQRVQVAAEPVQESQVAAFSEETAEPYVSSNVQMEDEAAEVVTRVRVRSRSAAPASSAISSEPDGFHITIVEEKNVEQRNRLLLGALALMLAVSVGTFFYSLFNLSFEVDAIDSEMESTYITEIDPLDLEQTEEERAAEKEGGGGGGGGKEQDKDASDGRLASQSQNPVNPPTPMPQLTNPELPQIMETQGNNERPITNQPLGIPGALSNDPSSGRGSGGGIGDGTGTGQGTGRGTGEGSGIGSGSGGGNGDGDGDGDGDGPPKLRTGPTTGVKILSKPRAQYTDSARQQQIQGKVVLKVTFQADGRIGAIVPVSGLGGGLTERAIAAARGISFEPAMKSGTPYSVTRTIEYTFTIY